MVQHKSRSSGKFVPHPPLLSIAPSTKVEQSNHGLGLFAPFSVLWCPLPLVLLLEHGQVSRAAAAAVRPSVSAASAVICVSMYLLCPFLACRQPLSGQLLLPGRNDRGTTLITMSIVQVLLQMELYRKWSTFYKCNCTILKITWVGCLQSAKNRVCNILGNTHFLKQALKGGALLLNNFILLLRSKKDYH